MIAVDKETGDVLGQVIAEGWADNEKVVRILRRGKYIWVRLADVKIVVTR